MEIHRFRILGEIMKPEHQNLTPTELALLTWHGGNDLEHISIKLAGEIGELLDLYGKHKYKPNFSWFDCKCGHLHTFDHCTWEEVDIDTRTIYTCPCQTLTPLVLDEMGDIWFYLRILVWNENSYLDKNLWYEFKKLESDEFGWLRDDINTDFLAIKEMYNRANKILRKEGIYTNAEMVYLCLNTILSRMGYTIEDLTRLNYIKLNSEESHHGWNDKNN
jgi:hypothetical protein